jgi:uncharacterized membrane protein YbhN (UPF0104 family)
MNSNVTPPSSNKSSRSALYLLLTILVVAALVWAFRSHIHFQWRTLPQQFTHVAWSHIALGIIVIYLCYGLRALRWSVLLAPMRKATALELLPAQVIGFTGVAIFGRVADLSRPYMIARRTQTTVTTQIAVYSIERAFDLAAAAILFSLALAFAPPSMPHHQAFARAGALSMAATLFLAAIAATIRFKGEALAGLTERILHPIVPKLADAAAARVLDLQSGFGAVSTFAEFFTALGLSLLMWLGIAACYLLTATSFRTTPTLATFSLSATMLILATGIGGSVVQLPIIGWFTQIALFATTLHALFGVPVETATACASLIFTVTNLAIIPAGLIMGQIQGIGLRDAVSSNTAA